MSAPFLLWVSKALTTYNITQGILLYSGIILLLIHFKKYSILVSYMVLIQSHLEEYFYFLSLQTDVIR